MVSRTPSALVVAILVALQVAAPGEACGQAFGIRGGIQETNLVADEVDNTFGTQTGLTLGGFLNLKLPANLYFSTEGMYTQKILTQQDAGTLQKAAVVNPNVTLELGTIEIPITLAWRAPLKGPLYPRVYGGPVIGVIVNERVDLDGQSILDAVDEAAILTKDAFAEREVGWIAGAGLTLSLADLGLGSSMYLLADVRYQSGITTLSEDFAGNPLNKQIRVGAFTGLLGVGF